MALLIYQLAVLSLCLGYCNMRKLFLGLVALLSLSGAIAYGNYNATQGAGTAFGSVVVGGIHYAQQFICDYVTPSQCANVDTHGQQLIDVNTTNNNLYSAITGPINTGTNVIGKVGIDQTTDGTTNLVASKQSGTWTVQPGNTANTTPWLSSVSQGGNTAVVKAANTAPTTSDAGLVSNINCSYTGSPCITLGGATAANSVPTVSAGFSFSNITTAATTTVKSGAGVLHTLTVNNLGTVASLTVVYDNTAGSGTKIASINTLASQTSYIYDVSFATGLTVVTTGTVAPDVTVSYR